MKKKEPLEITAKQLQLEITTKPLKISREREKKKVSTRVKNIYRFLRTPFFFFCFFSLHLQRYGEEKRQKRRGGRKDRNLKKKLAIELSGGEGKGGTYRRVNPWPRFERVRVLLPVPVMEASRTLKLYCAVQIDPVVV